MYKKMASSVGFEPTTLWLTAKCSNLLSYEDSLKLGDYLSSPRVSIVGVYRLNF